MIIIGATRGKRVLNNQFPEYFRSPPRLKIIIFRLLSLRLEYNLILYVCNRNKQNNYFKLENSCCSMYYGFCFNPLTLNKFS